MLTSLRLYSIAGGLFVAGSLSALYVARKRRKTPEQLERQRRDFLQQVGRIIDGTVIDVAEIEQQGGPVQLLIYTYDVAGVAYEASQDVTHLRQHIDMHTCRIGLPASIKYDPQNPGNSIVIAEGWSGLRTGKIIPLAVQQAARMAAQKASSSEAAEEATRSRH
jgi:hypothetical protein